MKNAFAKRVAWMGFVALLAAPLACSSGGSGGSAGGEGGSDEEGGSGGQSSGGKGGSGSGGKGGSGGSTSTGGKGGSGAGGSNAGGSGGADEGGSTGEGGASGGSSGGVDAGTAGKGGSGSGTDAGAGGSSGGSTGTGGTAGADCDYVDDKQFCECLQKNCGGDTLPDKNKKYHPVWCGTCPSTMVCVATATFAGGAAGACAPATAGLDAGQKKVAAALTSLWENSTSTIQYGYCEDIGDDRGYTTGRAGFCTGTGDGIVLAKCYSSVKPGNGLDKFLPELTSLELKFVAANGDFIKAKSGDTSKLSGYCSAFSSAASDSAFKGCQDAAVDAIYYGAALQHAAERHLTTALTKVALWDLQIMHGEADPKFGAKVQLAMADAKVKLSAMPTRDEESKWLGALLDIRAHIMDQYDEWQNNNYRCAMYEKLRRAGNLDFTGCVDTSGVKASTYWSGLSSSSAPSKNVCP